MSRNHQAVTKTQLQANKKAKQRLIIRLTYTILLISLLLWGWSVVRNPRFFPVTQVIIRGNYSHVNPAAIKSILQPYLNSGFFTVNTTKLQQELQELTWIQTATISRQWPGKIAIQIIEKVPVALWKTNGLVTQNGEIFFANISQIPQNLPRINASANLINEALAMLEKMNTMLNSIHLKITTFTLSAREAITLVLTPTNPGNINFMVLLGHDDVEGRLQRFIDVYPNVFANSLDQVQYADMRYTNGMAIKWKTDGSSSKNNYSMGK